MLEYCYLDHKQQTSVTFLSNCIHVHSRKCICKGRLQNVVSSSRGLSVSIRASHHYYFIVRPCGVCNALFVQEQMFHDDVIKWKHFPSYWQFLPGEFPAQWPVTRSFDIFFDLHPNKRLSKCEAGDLRRHRAHCHVIVMSVENPL